MLLHSDSESFEVMPHARLLAHLLAPLRSRAPLYSLARSLAYSFAPKSRARGRVEKFFPDFGQSPKSQCTARQRWKPTFLKAPWNRKRLRNIIIEDPVHSYRLSASHIAPHSVKREKKMTRRGMANWR